MYYSVVCLKIRAFHFNVISVKTVLFLPQFHALAVRHFHVLLFHVLHIGPSISCPACISCPAILMVRHFHVQHFQSTPIDQELTGAAASARGRRFVFTHQVAEQHFPVWNDVMTAILKLWRLIENPTPSVDADLREELFAKFHPDLIWNDGALGFLQKSAATYC